jgi:hypothetical protein
VYIMLKPLLRGKSWTFRRVTVVQLFSFLGIDVIHHKADIFLSKVIRASSLWKDPSNQLIINFNCTFLISTPCITIINLSPHSAIFSDSSFICFRVRKSASLSARTTGNSCLNVPFLNRKICARHDY